MRLNSVCVKGEANANKVAAFLVEQSQWFVFDPLPDGYYDFRVKTEYCQHLVAFMGNSGITTEWVYDISGMEQLLS